LSFLLHRFAISLLLLSAAGAGLGGCEWWGAREEPPLPGKRVAVMVQERGIAVDPDVSSLQVRLPRPTVNSDWAQAGGSPAHVMQHPILAEQPARAWSASIGSGSSSDQRILSGPVIAGGVIYALDSENRVTAVDARTGKQIWQVSVEPREERSGRIGGGVAFAGGKLFVSTSFAALFALDPADGKEIWRANTPAPLRAAPTVADGLVFVVTVDNQLFAIDVETGRTGWSHAGIAEIAGFLGGASPAVGGGVVLVGYSSGEIFALRATNGRILWSDTLSAVRRSDAISSLADIRGRPVIDRDLAIAISHSGRMIAIDIRSGQRAWEVPIGGLHQPWVAGDFIYVLSNQTELICLTRREGRVRWVRKLDPFRDMVRKRDPILWAGPVLAGDRLVVVSSRGEAQTFSPYSGEPLGRISVGGTLTIPPVVANSTLYFLTDDGDIVAYR
jgi:outer membrane protein assembly factor BamB